MRRFLPILCAPVAGALVALGACGAPVADGQGSSSATGSSTGSSTASSTASSASEGFHWASDPTSPNRIPLGDGKYATTPTAGSVFPCSTDFAGGGAQSTGFWVNERLGFWDLTGKPSVSGDVAWDASVSVTVDGTTRTVTTNDLPERSGTFPVASTDPAHQFDANPNAIAEQDLSFALPASPEEAAEPSCLPLGIVGVYTDGIVFFNALDELGRDAPAYEVQDEYGGHPQQQGVYHRHTFPSALLQADLGEPGSATVVGWALDGFPVVVETDDDGDLPTNADLDECHGRTSVVEVDGAPVETYHYDVTLEFPYTLGCFRGTPVGTGAEVPGAGTSGAQQPAPPQGQGQRPQPGQSPPPRP